MSKFFSGFSQVGKELAQNLTQQAQGFFTKHEDPDEQQGFQDLLSHLQPKQPSSLPVITSNLAKPASQVHDQVTSAELKMNQELVPDEVEEGWGINDDDLILDEPVVPVKEEKKETTHLLPVKKGIEDEKTTSKSDNKIIEEPIKQSWSSQRPSVDFTNKPEEDKPSSKDLGFGKNTDTAPKRKLSSQIKDLRDKATGLASGVANVTTGLTKNVAESFLWKVGKTEDTSKGYDSGSNKGNDFRRMFDGLAAAEDPSTPPFHHKKSDAEFSREGHGGKDENTMSYKEQIQRYMAQAHQLEMLIKVEQEMLREEHGKKIKDLQSMQEEANVRLEACQAKERELRTLDEKLKLKENLSFDEAHLDKIAKEIQDTQEKISTLEEKNQFLELSLKNEQERLQTEMNEKLESLRSESTTHLSNREAQLRNEHDTTLRERVDYYQQEIAREQLKYREIVEKIRNWTTSFQEYKKKIRATMIEVEEILWARGEEYQSSAQILRDFQEKVVQLGRNYKAKLEQKDQKIAKLQETERGLHEEISAFQKEKTQALSVKEKEIKELKNQYQKLEKAHGIEKDYHGKAQQKLEEVLAKAKEAEEKLRAAEKEKSELRQGLENEKRNSSNLQERIDELSQRGKDVEGTTKTLEKTNNEMKKALEKEKKKVLELQSQLDIVSAQDKQNDNRLVALERQNEEWEEILDKEKSNALALQLRLDEAEAREQERLREKEALTSEKSEVEERYTQEIQTLKQQNYTAENSYMKEIEGYLEEIKTLKASRDSQVKEIEEQLEEINKLKAEKESVKPVIKSVTNQEADKTIKELSKQIQEMNEEKIQLMKKYKQEKTQLIEKSKQEEDQMIEKHKQEKAELEASNVERFKNTNFYIEELYKKNHELTEDNTKLVTKFNKLKEKLISLDTNFKHLGTHPHSNSPKLELRQLLANFNIFSGPSSDAAPETPSRDDFKEELHEETKLKSAELGNKGLGNTLQEQAEPRSGVSPQREVSVFTSEMSPALEEKKKRSFIPQSKSVGVTTTNLNNNRKSENNFVVQRSPTVKDLPPHSAKAELQSFLDQKLEVQEQEGWGNLDTNIQDELSLTKDPLKRPKSAHERMPSFSEIESPTGIESAIMRPTVSISQENTPRQKSGLGAETANEFESPKFEGQESPRFESRQVDTSVRKSASRVEDFESPTFEGKKLGDYVKTQNDSFSNLDEKGGDGWDMDIDTNEQGSQLREENNSPTFEPEFGQKKSGLESPTFKVSDNETTEKSQRRKSGMMEEIKMSISPRLRNRSPSFSNYEEEDRERKERELNTSYQKYSQGRKTDKSADNSINVSKGIIDLESPKFRSEEEPNEPRFGGSASTPAPTQKAWNMEVDLTEENRNEPRFGGSAEEIVVPEQKGGWGFDDDLGVSEGLEANKARTSGNSAGLFSQKNKSFQSPELKPAENLNQARKDSEKLGAGLAQREQSLGVEGAGWGFDVEIPATDSANLKDTNENTNNLGTVPHEEPLEIQEGGWDTDINLEKPIEDTNENANNLGTVAHEEPLEVEGGWDTDFNLEKPIEEPITQKSPAKVSEPTYGAVSTKTVSDPLAVSPGIGGGWDVGVDLDANAEVHEPSHQSPTKQKSPVKVPEPETLNVGARGTSDAFGGSAGGWDVGVDVDNDIVVEDLPQKAPAKQKSPAKETQKLSVGTKGTTDPFGESPVVEAGGWDVGVELDPVELPPQQAPTKQKSPAKVSEPPKLNVKEKSDPFAEVDAGGWDVGVELDAGADVELPKVSSSIDQSSAFKKSGEAHVTTASGPSPGLQRASVDTLKLEKENKTNLEVKNETTPLKSAPKLGPTMTFDTAVKKPGFLVKGNSDDKKDAAKPKGLTINKVFLPKKTDNKLSLGKPKEANDDINLEEFLGSSLK